MNLPQDQSHRIDREDRSDIAIIGMAGLFPGAPNLDTYWQNIVSKVDAITDPPPDEWDVSAIYDPESTENDRVYCKRGGFISPLATFDPLDHNIMPITVQGGEPDQWLALQVACDALADAGYGREIPERRRTAVILGKGTYLNRGNLTVAQHGRMVGQVTDIIKKLHPEFTEDDLAAVRQDLKQCLPPFNSDTAPALIPNIIAGRIANRLDLMGPNYTIDAACASSLIALEHAIRGLRTREFDLALVGGVHIITPAPTLMLFCQLGALSRNERIRPFDENADGTILGAGIGMVVLKRREDAERDGQRIYALVKGVGISSDGRGSSVMAPRLEGEVLALQRAYEDTGIAPRTIGLIEAHGTGTPVGDVAELKALTQIFGLREDALPYCALGSVKSMISHLMPAAGIAGLIKTAMALYHKVLPPTLNVEKPNPRLELETSPFYINSETRPWIHGNPDVPRRAGVNSFGFGGINAHAILEEHAPSGADLERDHLLPWDTEACIVSAVSRADLVQRLQHVQRFLQAYPDVMLQHVAYSLNTNLDESCPYRVAMVASTIEDLQQKLDRALSRLSDPQCQQIKETQGIYFFGEPQSTSGQVVFMFPGEGSQYLNMLADLCIHFPEVRHRFDVSDRLFITHDRHFVPSDVIFPRPAFSESERRDIETRLWQMEGAFETVLTSSLGLLTLLHRLGIEPDRLVGHSTGEYTAMLASGMIELNDDDQIGQFATELNRMYYQQAEGDAQIPRAALLAIGAGADTVAAICEQAGVQLYVAMDNCPHQTIVIGQEHEIDQVTPTLQQKGLIYEHLSFDRPYHTPLFQGFSDPLRAFFSRWVTASPHVPMYSCTTTAPFPSDREQTLDIAVDHWVSPVKFRQTIDAIYRDGGRIFVEVGPRGNLTAFVDDILRGQAHSAVPANVEHRSGITQLNHLVAHLAARGVPMQLDYLYQHRSPRWLDLNPSEGGISGLAGDTARRDPIPLAVGWLSLSLSEQTVQHLQVRSRSSIASEAMNGVASHPPMDDATKVGMVPPQEPSSPVSQPDRIPQIAPPAADTQGAAAQAATPSRQPASQPAPTDVEGVMTAYFQTMEQFVAMQEEVMQAYLAPQNRSNGPTAHPTQAAPTIASGAQQAVPTDLPVSDPTPVSSPPVPAPGPTVDHNQTEVGQSTAPEEGAAESLDGVVGALAGFDPSTANQMLLELVSDRTGYPIDMLDLDLDLEADLGIDSIKRVEIMGSFQQQTNLKLDDEMEALASSRTLRQIMDFFRTRLSGETDGVGAAPATPMPQVLENGVAPPNLDLPFIRTVVSYTPGESLVAMCDLNLDTDRFLHDHTLGGQNASTDAIQRGLPVMPLTMSMEILAEAATVLMPGYCLVSMHEVRAYQWMALDEPRFNLKLVAKRHGAAENRQVFVQLFEAESESEMPAPIVEGLMAFDVAYPEQPAELAPELRGARPSAWAPESLYETFMFHDAAFRGVVSMDTWAENGVQATLQRLPADHLFQFTSAPALVTDPVLLDQPGQVVGFWMAEHLSSGYIVFPFRLEALYFYTSSPSASHNLTCRGRIALVGAQQVRSDLDIVGPDQQIWARLQGWWDLRFEVPSEFFQFLKSPQALVMSEPWTVPSGSGAEAVDRHAYRLSADHFPEHFFTSHRSIWQRVLAHMVLSPRERELWNQLPRFEARRLEWLLGRVVAKDALRTFVQQRHGLNLYPADVEILPDAHGRPVARGDWTEAVPQLPVLSIAHVDGVAVALVEAGVSGVGIDIEAMGRLHADVERVAFTPGEHALLATLPEDSHEAWALRFWCAKEAVAKALGHGAIGGPQALVVQHVDAATGVLQVGLEGEMARQFPNLQDQLLTAYTSCDQDLVTAIAVHL